MRGALSNLIDTQALSEKGGLFWKPWVCCRSFESIVGYCSALVVYGENSTGMPFPSYHWSVPNNPDIYGEIQK